MHGSAAHAVVGKESLSSNPGPQLENGSPFPSFAQEGKDSDFRSSATAKFEFRERVVIIATVSHGCILLKMPPRAPLRTYMSRVFFFS